MLVYPSKITKKVELRKNSAIIEVALLLMSVSIHRLVLAVTFIIQQFSFGTHLAIKFLAMVH